MTPRWLAIVDLSRCAATGHCPSAAAIAAIDGGAPRVVLRGRGVSPRRLYDVVDSVLECAPAERVVVNDRADICAAFGLGGVHLPASGLPVAAARAVCGPLAAVGVSAHDAAELTLGARATWAFVSPIWPTASKPSHPGIGLDGLRILASQASVPILALGGVTPERVTSVVEAGAHGCAALSPFSGDPDVARDAARAFARAFERV